MNDAEIKMQVILDDKQAGKSINNLENKTKKLGGQFKKAGKILTAGLTVPLVGFGALALKEAMEFESTGAKFGEVFGNMADDVDDFINEFKKLSPVTRSEGRVLISGIQDMLVPLGFAREEATQMSKEFMHLAGALGNFGDKSVTVEQTMGAMQSALAGQMMPLRNLGIVTNAAEIEQKALELSGKKLTKELTQQDKATAILKIAYENSTDALNAYTEANLDVDTKLKIATADFRDQAMVLGTHLLPVLEKGIGLFQKLNEWLGQLTPTQQKLILVIGGLLAVLGPVLMAVGGLIMFLPMLKAAFLVLTGPIGLIALAIAGLVALFIYLWTTSEEFRDVVTSVFNFVWQNVLKPFFQNIKHIFDGIASIIKGAFMIIKGILTGDLSLVLGGVGTMFKGLLNVVTGVLNMLISQINNMINLALLPINAMISALNLIPGLSIGRIRVNIPRIPKLETGTNNVPKEGLYHLHPGEAVVPKKYNPAIGGAGQIIQITMPDIYMDNDKVGRAVTPVVSKTLRLGGAY